ncbi:hypothetical protein Voc01_080050 [Virgisporangium ochraceum]|uniref:GGDEF domain-containing protein n=2 Tax=Virgisporangium ochraceum TaxID=65505 RepID=A0A8J4A2P8_9ACTN|nr:hypothetical protein Voc01_080050 [Virgisporangium ochraceum]
MLPKGVFVNVRHPTAQERNPGADRQRVTARRFMGICVVAVAAYQLLPDGLWWETAGQFSVGLAAAVVVFASVRRQPRGMRWTWVCFAVGILLHASGHVAFAVSVTLTGGSGLDLWWLLLYPLVAAGALGVLRRHRRQRDLAAVVDSVIVATGTGVLCWVAVIAPAVGDESMSPGHRLVLMAYPVADILLIALVTRLLGQHDRDPAVRWITAALGFVLVCDLCWVVSGMVGIQLADSQPVYRAVQQLFLVAYCCMAVGSRYPVAGPSVQRVETQAGRGAWQGLLLTTASTLVAPLVLWGEASDGRVDHGRAIAVGCGLLFVLAAARIAVTLRELTRTADRLRDMARHDALTELPNRRAWNERFPWMLQDCLRTGATVSVALLDLDRFKEYNDTRGHQAGDDLLADTARVWRAELRAGDLLARYGGEEFVVLMVDADAGEAVRVLDRLRAVTPRGQSFSAGIATWDRYEEPHRLLHRADQALYQAKADGRDRAVVAAV